MVKAVLISLFISTQLFAYIPHNSVLIESEFNVAQALADDPKKDDISAEQAAEVVSQFVGNLYFRSDDEREEFLFFVKDKLLEVINDNLYFDREKLVDRYDDVSLDLLFQASDTIEAYDRLKRCQLDKNVPIDPLSAIVANTLIQSVSNFNNATTDGVLRTLVYSYYRQVVIDYSKDIYEKRLLECQQYDDFYYVERDGEKEINENLPSIDEINEDQQLATGDAGANAIQS